VALAVPRDDSGVPDRTLSVGVAVWLLSEAMFFAGLFAAYFTLKAAATAWPPDGVELETLRAGLFTSILVVSSFTMHRAVRAAEHDGAHEIRVWLGITVVLGAVFLAGQLTEYRDLHFGVDTHAYGTSFYLLTGFHGLHVFGGLLAMVATGGALRSGSRAPAVRTARALGAYWHFVDIVWVAMFVVLYLVR
jgi:cytochrome c oxidase subunit 3